VGVGKGEMRVATIYGKARPTGQLRLFEITQFEQGHRNNVEGRTMTVDVVVPAELWEGDLQAVVTAWFRDNGAVVREGELLLEIMVEKVQCEISAPAAGAVTIVCSTDAEVRPGTVVGRIDES